MGIDPRYAIMGYDVVSARSDKYRPIEYGVTIAQASKVSEDRLVLICNSMCAVPAHNRLDAVSIERPYFTNNKVTAIGVAKTHGVVLLTVRKTGVPIFEYTSLQVKQTVIGYGQTEKPQTMEMTRKLLCLAELPRPDDTADASVTAICHGQAAGSPLYRAVLSGGIR